MENTDLIALVRPTGGWYGFLAVKDKTRTRQCMVETREELDAEIEKYVADRWCVFFALAKFKTGASRTQENAESLQSFWVDIDCGPDKALIDSKTGRPEGYETQAAGFAALRDFCAAVKLPRPLIVNSGNGLHAYWPLTEEVAKEEWEPVAKGFRQLCIEHNFYIDTKVFESARVLRPLNSFNFKGDSAGNPAKPVEILSTVDPVPFAQIRDILGVVEGAVTKPKPKRPMSALGKALSGALNSESSFDRIMQLTQQGKGCPQIGSCYVDRATLAEPRWFDALSVAKFCSDRDTAIHALSKGHPDYAFDTTERKVTGIGGPHSCAEFEVNNPGGCEGCLHKDKRLTKPNYGPIALGRVIARSTSPTVTVKVEGELPVEHEMPKLPEKYFRTDKGAIYKEAEEVEDGEEAPLPTLVYENNLYVVKLMDDPLSGFVAVIKHHLPKDGVKEFVIPNEQLTDRTELRRKLARYGVIAHEGRHKHITEYILASVKEKQIEKKADIMRVQFGWADKDSKFIVGDREITATGVYHSPPSSSIATMVPFFEPQGTLENWKKAFKLYGRPGLELQAFGALSGFGAPLLKFTGQKGAVINFIHSDSGTGKTTILRMANSIFGDPEMLLGTPDDTDVGKILKVGFLNNIVNTMDEITNMTPLAASKTLYAYSQGRGKDKAKANANELRENNITWRTISISSSNASFYEKLGQLKNNPDGEMMRLLEFKIPYTDTPVISTQEGKDLLDHMLNANFGKAGEVYMQYIIGHLEEVKSTVLKVQAKFDTELRLTQRERNWSAVLAVNIAGGYIAHKLGLLEDWSMGRIYRAVSAQVVEMRKDTLAPVSNASSIVGDFINRHHHNMLVIDGVSDGRSGKVFPILEPKGDLFLRYEPDTKKLFIAVNAFKNDCVDVQVNYKDTLNQLKASGTLLGVQNCRLSTGSNIPGLAVRAIILDASHPDFMDMGVVVEANKPDMDNVVAVVAVDPENGSRES